MGVWLRMGVFKKNLIVNCRNNLNILFKNCRMHIYVYFFLFHFPKLLSYFLIYEKHLAINTSNIINILCNEMRKCDGLMIIALETE